MKITKEQLLHKGGSWLGAIRSWIQWNAINGSQVTWGSDEPLRFTKALTVKDLEELAAEIAANALNYPPLFSTQYRRPLDPKEESLRELNRLKDETV
jgi:hypothetical protein